MLRRSHVHWYGGTVRLPVAYRPIMEPQKGVDAWRAEAKVERRIGVGDGATYKAHKTLRNRRSFDAAVYGYCHEISE